MAPNDEKKLEIARNIPISSTSRISKYNSLRSRSLRVSFSCKADADLLLEWKKKLPEGVFVDREYSEKDEKEQKLLRPILKSARKLPHYRGKCKIDGTDLVIKGKKYNRKTLTNLPEDLNTYSLSSTENDNTIGFFGELNLLSNFHMAPFVYNNTEYICSEQLIQHQKAKLFCDTEIASKILDATDAITCKRLSKDNQL